MRSGLNAGSPSPNLRSQALQRRTRLSSRTPPSPNLSILALQHRTRISLRPHFPDRSTRCAHAESGAAPPALLLPSLRPSYSFRRSSAGPRKQAACGTRVKSAYNRATDPDCPNERLALDLYKIVSLFFGATSNPKSPRGAQEVGLRIESREARLSALPRLHRQVPHRLARM